MSRLYVEPRKRRRRRQSPSDSSVMLHVLRDGGAAGIEELAGSETLAVVWRIPSPGQMFSKFLRGCEPIAHRSGILKRRGAIFFPGSYQFDSGPPDGTLRSSVVHSPGRASSNPLAWLASPLPGLFPLPPTRPASVVPGLSTSAPRRGVYWQTGTHPRKVSHRRSACGPGAARPLIQKRSRRCTSAHTKAPDGPGSQRSGPGSSRRRPAAAGRLHRYPPITPPNSKHAGLRRRRGPALPVLPSFAFLVSPSGRHRRD